jgi:hypothetical protein
MKRPPTIGCRSKHFYHTVGKKQICLYCEDEFKEKFVLPKGETWIVQCSTFGYKIFYREYNTVNSHLIYGGHDVSEILRLVHIDQENKNGILFNHKRVYGAIKINLKEEGIKILEKLINEKT